MSTSPFELCDLPGLYHDLAERLERIVRFDVRAPDAIVEDACQFAWDRLVEHPRAVRRGAVLSWLATTAVREACRMLRRDQRDLSLEAAVEGVTCQSVPGPEELLERLESLATLRALPVRQQRLLWLQGLGLSYQEMAKHEGCSRRTVERQLLRGKERLRTAFEL